MSQTPLKQQMLNYTSLFKQLFIDYYRHQKKFFWWVQLLMVVSTLTGIFWILSVILGISHYQNPTNVEGIKYLLFAWVFDLPLWQWLMLASFAGVISAWTLYLSVQTGVTSVLAYQKYLAQKCLNIVSQEKHNHWPNEFDQTPRLALLRILRQGIQLTGLVSRRVTRAFVSFVTFILALFVLIYLDAKLLLLLLPFSILYIVALYFINRYAARVSTEMSDILPVSSGRFSQLLSAILSKKLTTDSQKFTEQFDDSLYMRQAELKYKRRLAEIHVNWMNTLFLVVGIAIIIVYIVYIQVSENIDWQRLLFFLIALKYAASSLQQISSTTVAFSRFMPEVQLVFRLLKVVDKSASWHKLDIDKNTFVLINSNCIDAFEIQQIENQLNLTENSKIISIAQIREQGVIEYFKKLSESPYQNVIIDNNLGRLQRIVSTHRNNFNLSIQQIIVLSGTKPTKKLSIEEFLNYTQQESSQDIDYDVDTFE